MPLWRGPATGRVRILDPYRVRAARARALFCLSLQDGVFPSAAPPDPLLSEDRRREIGNPDLRRTDPADEERYLFHSCVSRPTDRLYLSWQGCDEDGTALARSPFLDEVCDLLELDPEVPRTARCESAAPSARCRRSTRRPASATSPERWRSAAGRSSASRCSPPPAPGASAPRIEAMFAELRRSQPATRARCARPRCSAELGERDVFSANSLEGWVTCSYKWFVEHELDPQRLEPTADPLWLGSIIHDALDRLYTEAPGADSIPRPGDVDDWQRRFGELLDEVVAAHGGPAQPRPARRRSRAPGPGRGVPGLGVGDRDRVSPSPRPAGGRLRSIRGRGRAAARAAAARRGRAARADRPDRRRRDGRAPSSTTTRPARTSPRRTSSPSRESFRSSSTCGSPSGSWASTSVGGLYHPLGAVGERKPRGLVAREDEDLKGLGIVGTDRLEHDDFELALDEAEALARDSAAEMRAGEIRRHPIGGKCPKYCNFQAICRLERAIGVDENGNGG